MFKELFKASLKAFNIDCTTWESAAKDRSSWRLAVRAGSQVSERNRLAEVEKETEQTELCASVPAPIKDIHKYLMCSRNFRAQIGIISHMGRHKTKEPGP